MPKPVARLTVITLGASDVMRSVAFYDALGFSRRMQATGNEVAFFDTGGAVLALYGWDALATESGLAASPRPQAFHGVTLAWNCVTESEVDDVMMHAVACGARLLKPAAKTSYGGYAGYFTDPDEHVWEVVVAPGIEVQADRRVTLPD